MSDLFDSFPEPRLIHADASVVALLKPERMHTAPLPSAGPGPASLCDWAFERFPELRQAASPSPRLRAEGGLLHRLDFETSGLVLFARTAEAHAFLLVEQAAGRFRKDYLLWAYPSAEEEPRGSRPARSEPQGLLPEDWRAALRACLEGAPDSSEGLDTLCGLIENAAARAEATRGPGPRVESRFKPYGPASARVACVADDPERTRAGAAGKRRGTKELYATEFLGARRVEDGLELRVRLERGFRHQIRAHLAWVGLPIAGEPLYGGRPWPRLCLHACRLSFRHPGGGELTLEC